VSEHEAATEGAHHKPERRRHRDHAPAADASPPLQMVETHGAAPSAAPAEDNLPRRTKPRRRRRDGTAAGEPLQMVETDGGSEPTGDSTPTP
jgi:hypothetical protein